MQSGGPLFVYEMDRFTGAVSVRMCDLANDYSRTECMLVPGAISPPLSGTRCSVRGQKNEVVSLLIDAARVCNIRAGSGGVRAAPMWRTSLA